MGFPIDVVVQVDTPISPKQVVAVLLNQVGVLDGIDRRLQPGIYDTVIE